MNAFKIRLSMVFTLLVFLFVAGNALAENPSVFETYNLKYGISIKIPHHWRIIDKQVMDSIDTNTEILTRIGQGNNDIIIAANYYDNQSSGAAATVRISVRIKQTETQNDVAAMTQADIDAYADQGYKMVLAMLEKSGDKTTRITPYKGIKDTVADYVALRFDYQEIGATRKFINTIYLIPLGNKNVKITMSYDVAQTMLLAPTVNEIKNSIRIGR
ncbi:MAG: hypothetical protein DM484_10855 [Candidatus Methylumidiphilus alinenensis]|uniref:PsbP C-terminal domain-containing protein n=1 Tax=Candidatus Methylumidiphilus alinenensis TaxID=2202197 RepID=A0A2W4R6R4_9GAMM|nr:MAG: hypothetical protein DM484_10855 [Candidatus Methylumidiphilus alinenensis]